MMNATKRTILSLSFCLSALGATLATANTDKDTTSKAEHWCVVGGSRGVAHALVTELDKQNIPCTVLVRDTKKVTRYFGTSKNVHIVKGAITSSSAADLIAASEDATHIFMGQTFPFKIWEKSIRQGVANCLQAAKANDALFVYPGRIYKYGMQTPISETTKAIPADGCTQGAVLREVENSIEQATLDGDVNACTVRHPYPWGAALGDGMLDKNFALIPNNKRRSWWESTRKFEWIGSTKIPVQLCYTPDLARFIIEYSRTRTSAATSYDTINFAGHTFASMDVFGKQFCELAEEEYRASELSKFWLQGGGMLVDAEAKRGADIYYSFDNSILLDDAKMRELFPDFKHTELATAHYQTLSWYQEQVS